MPVLLSRRQVFGASMDSVLAMMLHSAPSMAASQQPVVDGDVLDAPPTALADAMRSAWITFAKTGDPGWPAYDLATRITKRFDATSSVVADPEKETRPLWKDVAF